MTPDWQLMEQPISLQEFEDLPLLRSTFFHFGLGLEGEAEANNHLHCGAMTLGATTLSITTLSIKGLYVTLSISDTQLNNALQLC
jgi:hypothetical protein